MAHYDWTTPVFGPEYVPPLGSHRSPPPPSRQLTPTLQQRHRPFHSCHPSLSGSEPSALNPTTISPSALLNESSKTTTATATTANNNKKHDIPVASSRKSSGVVNLTSVSSSEESPSPSSSSGSNDKQTPPRSQSQPGKTSTKRKSMDHSGNGEAASLKDRKGSTEEEEHTHEGDEDDGTGKGGKGPKTTDRRKEQNRNAQRAFRERKEKRLHELEEQVAALQAVQDNSTTENANLRDLITRLQTENQRLTVFEQAFTFSVSKPNTLLFTPPFEKPPTPPESTSTNPEATALGSGAGGAMDFEALARSVQANITGTPQRFSTSFGQTPAPAARSTPSLLSSASSGPSPSVSGSRSASVSASDSSSPEAAMVDGTVGAVGVSSSGVGGNQSFFSFVDSGSSMPVSSSGTSTSTGGSLLSTSPMGTSVSTGMGSGSTDTGAAGLWGTHDYDMSSLTFLNDWDADSMSFFNDMAVPLSSTAASTSVAPLQSEGLQDFADMFAASGGASVGGWVTDGSVGGSMGGSVGGWGSGWTPGPTVPESPMGIASASANANVNGFGTWRGDPTASTSSTAPPATAGTSSSESIFDLLTSSSTPLNPTTIAIEKLMSNHAEGFDVGAPCMRPFKESGVLSDGELDGLCELLKTKASCGEKRTFLDSIAANKPGLEAAVQMFKYHQELVLAGNPLAGCNGMAEAMNEQFSKVGSGSSKEMEKGV